MASLLRKLQDKSLLSDSEMLIAKYLIENYREVSNLSTRELAARTYTSSAAIVRFSQKFGFKGYSDFRINFLTEIMKHGEEIQAQLISEQDNLDTIMKKVREINIDAINQSYDMLNPALLARTLKLFESATYIDFYVMDRYMNLANEVAETFVFAGKFSTIHNSMPLQYLQAYKTPKNHLGFFYQSERRKQTSNRYCKTFETSECPDDFNNGFAGFHFVKVGHGIFHRNRRQRYKRFGQIGFYGRSKIYN